MSTLTQEITSLLDERGHPCRQEIDQLRKLILEASPQIEEGIKWNSMSFRTTEWFSTLNLRQTKHVQFVFHLGAKPKTESGVKCIPTGALSVEWKSADRAIVDFPDSGQIGELGNDFQDFVRAWIEFVS